MKRNNDHCKTTQLLTLLVFGVFALCVAAVLLTGAKTYRNLTDRGSTAHERRVAVRYLTTRFHQAPEVQVEDFGGVEAMTVREQIGSRTYLTRVYCYDGYLRELFSAENAAVDPEDGEKVLEAETLTFSREGNLLTANITLGDGTCQQLLLSHATWKEAAP